MPDTLTRANTLWPRATAKPPDLSPTAITGDQESLSRPKAPRSPPRSSSDVRTGNQKHFITKKQTNQEDCRPLRKIHKHLDSVPVPPSFRVAERPDVVSKDKAPSEKFRPENNIYNRHMVPTARALSQSIVITQMCVWELYEAIELCDNQGTCPDRRSSVICRRKMSSDAQECLFVVKEQRWSGVAVPRHCVKPRSPYLVDLLGAFFQAETIWTIYEEMDTSLEQIFELDCDPWTIDPGKKDRQIGAISFQVLRGLEYIHKNLSVAHGAICARNILLKRTGRVKLANVGTCLLERAVTEVGDDTKAFADVLARLFAPDMPVKAVLRRCLSDCAFEFYQCVFQSSPSVALEHRYLADIQPAYLSKLVVRTMRSIYVPPNPVSGVVQEAALESSSACSIGA